MRTIVVFVVYLLVIVVADNGTFVISSKMAQACKEHICRDGYSYQFMFSVDNEELKEIRKDSDMAFEIHIGIQAMSNGHILLSPVPKPGYNDPVYEIVVGGGGNQFTELRRHLKRDAKSSIKTPKILSTFEVRGFYIKIHQDGTVEFGKEGQILPLISYHDVNPLEIKYFSFAAWSGVEAKFLYDCPILKKDGSQINADSQEVDQQISMSDQLKRSLLQYKLPWVPPRPTMDVRLGVKVTNMMYDAFESKLATTMSVVVINKRKLKELQCFNPTLDSDNSAVTHTTLQTQSTIYVTILLLLLNTPDDAPCRSETYVEDCVWSVSWTDETMAWYPTKFNGTTNLKFRQGQIWRPKFYVFNSDDQAMFDARNSELISMVYSGEATFHFQTKVYTWCVDTPPGLSRWPHDEYECSIVIQPWEVHDKIGLEIMDIGDIKMKYFSGIDDEIKNEWELATKQLIVKPTIWNEVYKTDDKVTHQSDRLIINVQMKRNATAYNIVFYTPLLVLMMFVLFSFWSEPLTMNRVWFFAGCSIVICMGLCYIDYLIPCHTLPSILVLYIVVLQVVLLGLLIQVVLMKRTVEKICSSSLMRSLFTKQIFRFLFCLPAMKITISEGYTVQEDEEPVTPRGQDVEEMESEKQRTFCDKRELAEVIDRIMFVVYSVVFAALLAAHF